MLSLEANYSITVIGVSLQAILQWKNSSKLEILLFWKSVSTLTVSL